MELSCIWQVHLAEKGDSVVLLRSSEYNLPEYSVALARSGCNVQSIFVN